jgi:HK97 family phage prohead protease
MPKTANTPYETRAIKGIEVRAAPEGSDSIGVLEGYAAVFNSDSVEFEGWEKNWIERIEPGAFARSLREQPDIKALWSHRSDMPIARAPGTLDIREDDTGLKVSIQLADTTVGRDLLANVRAGNVDAMSFGFEMRSQRIEENDDIVVRTLTDVDLIEVSAVVWPAYPDTSLAIRSIERELKEQREDDDGATGPEGPTPGDDPGATPKPSPAPQRRLWASRLGITD